MAVEISIPCLIAWLNSIDSGIAICSQLPFVIDTGISLAFDFLFFKDFITDVTSLELTGGTDIDVW